MAKPKPISLSNLAQSSAQEVFDWVAYNLLKQRKRSERILLIQDQVSKIVNIDDNHSFCAYRGDNETKCAAGWIISDEEYKPEFERNYWSSLVYDGIAPDAHLHLIRSLQRIHDQTPPQQWKHALAILADRVKLSSNVVEDFQ